MFLGVFLVNFLYADVQTETQKSKKIIIRYNITDIMKAYISTQDITAKFSKI